MDRRSWPWRKKTSEKSGTEKAVSASDSHASSAISLSTQDVYKKTNYVRISMESYSHLSGLEDQVKTYVDQIKTLEDEVKELNEKLSASQKEMTNKDNLVKQHAKVAEDAVSGWEKAEAEALAVKNQLESVTLLKLAAEGRASHLDDALKECMKQIRNLKEEHQQELHEVILAKTKQWDKIKLEHEAKIGSLTQELLRSGAENVALSRSLQERSNMLLKTREEKSQDEAEIELMKGHLESTEREISSLKYELHIVTKDLEIRNEEKNMSVKSAEVANKQHLEGVKKIAKLEAECQRLRVLVRKKLPGPAAVAQMKLEVENLDRDYLDTLRTSPVKCPDFSLDSIQKSHKENEFLTKRILAMEEETKMLKEALAKRNSELLASRNYCAQTVSKFQSLESQLQGNNQQKSTSTSNLQISNEGSDRQCADSVPSFTSISIDGNDEEVSCTASLAAASSIYVLSHSKKEKSVGNSNNAENAHRLEIMDDFLEIEKLAYLSNESNSVISASDELNNARCAVTNCKLSSELVHIITEELRTAISSIHDFVLAFGNEAQSVQYRTPDGDELSQKIQWFSATFEKLMNREIGLTDFVLDLSHVLNKSKELKFKVVGCRNNEVEINNFDCIDKVALPEDKAVQDTKGARYSKGCALFSYCTSDPNIPHEGSFSLEEFELLKVEKDNMVLDLARCSENMEITKTQLQETVHLLEETKSELASAQKFNSLSETQLKCMTESYKSLETRAEDLQTKVNLLQAKIESLLIELQEERRCHQEALAKCKDLEEHLQRNVSCAVADIDVKPNQERELAAAAEKLAECQDTIFHLGKQLKALYPQTELTGLSHSKRIQKGEVFDELKTTTTGKTSQAFDQIKMETFSNDLDSMDDETPQEIFNSTFCPSKTEPNSPVRSPTKSKRLKHRHTKSGSSHSSSTPTPEKYSRGFSRFFSAKGKNGC